jgi:hypothetical protein
MGAGVLGGVDMTSRLIIKAYQPGKTRIRAALVTLVAVGMAWFLYGYGLKSAAGYNADLVKEHERRGDELRASREENEQLRERIAVLERSSQIDRQAYDTVDRALSDVQDEMLELKEELAFYRGIVSPAETARGINITRFTLRALGQVRAYRYKLVLSQVKQNESVITGAALLTFEGIMAGAQRQLTLHDLAAGKGDDLKLKFKYFQNIEGDVVLPEGFVPSRVVVEVVPNGGGAERIKRTFNWSELIA